MLTTRAKNKIDKAVSEIVRRRCNNVPIDIMKISGVFKAAYDAAETGADIESAVVSKYFELAGVQAGFASADARDRWLAGANGQSDTGISGFQK